MTNDIGARLVQAIAELNEAAIAECFAPEAELRALIPPGLRERRGAKESAGLIFQWFRDSTEIHLSTSKTETIADRFYISYRFIGVEAGEAYVVEQQLYCILGEGKIARADLLCSGFRPSKNQS